MANLLVVHYSHSARQRATITDHLYSFRRLSGHRCFYWNAALGTPPRYLRRLPYDLVIFHYTFMSMRFHPPSFATACVAMDFLRHRTLVKSVIVQDEQKHADLINRFVNEWGVSHIFSCAQPSEWPKIYPEVDRDRVVLHTVLTGYLSERTVARIQRLAARRRARQIDIGYRSWDPWPSLGRHGRLKGEIGHLFRREAPRRGLTVDISNDYGDEFRGDDWYRFLLKCKYTIGVEGGSGVLDWDGTIEDACRGYMRGHPGATFEEIEAACFPGRDGELDYVALSPRHLECCATRTCQILVQGHYDGVLVAGVHYIPLRRDFSNVQEILESVRRDDLRTGMVERAYRDVAQGRQWTYGIFVKQVLSVALPEQSRAEGAWQGWAANVALVRSRLRETATAFRWWMRGAGGSALGERRFHVLVVGTKNIWRRLARRPLIDVGE